MLKATAGVATVFAVIVGLTACTRYALKAPPMGVTNMIMTPGTVDYFATFDSTRGLFVFSYEVTGMSGDDMSGLKEETIAGVRMWEYRFKKSDPATMYQSRVIAFTKSSDDFLGSGGTTKTSSGKLNAVFNRGEVVYGGHLISRSEMGGFGRWAVKLVPNDSAYSRFLSTNVSALKSLRIDTVIVPLGDI